MSVQVLKRLFTTEDYHRMLTSGILSENDHVELLGGEIVEMSPIGSRHAACVKRLNRLLSRKIGDRGMIGVQDPIHLDARSEPQPDLVVLRPRADFYATTHPQPEDVLLIVEVAETSAGYDREVKLPLYAQAGIPEVWLVDLAEEGIRAFTKPLPQEYDEIRHYWRSDVITPQTFPDVQIALTDILG